MVFLPFVFVLSVRIHHTAKVSEEQNRNTIVQLLAVYTDPNAKIHRVIEEQTDRQTHDIMMPTADHSLCSSMIG